MKKKLYKKIAGNDKNKDSYESLHLKWKFPINDVEGVLSILKNITYIIGYVQKYKCSKKCIDEIIENEIQPNIINLKDEMDYVLGIIILVLCNEKIDFTDKKELEKCELEIVGKLIQMFEEIYKLFGEEENAASFENSNISDGYIDTSELEIGMVVRNYKEMCKILKEEIKTGKAKQLQLKEWERYFEWEKSGQKFIVTDIYDTPLSKQDKRRIGNNSVYVKYIELILLQYLSKQEGYTKTFTKRNWWELLGMVNGKYNRVSKKYLEDIDHTITKFEINHFYQRCNKKLEQILFSALNNLKNRKLLIWEMQTVIVTKEICEGSNFILANDKQKKLILEVERYILKNVMGYEKMFQIFCHFKQEEYYKKVNEKLYELYGWDHYFKQIKMIYTQKDVLEAIEQSKIDLQKAVLNEKIIKVLNNNAEKKYNADKKKWEEQRNNLIFGEFDTSLRGVWNIPDTYLEAQRILTDELINIGHKNQKILLDQFEMDDELSQLFTSFMC